MIGTAGTFGKSAFILTCGIAVTLATVSGSIAAVEWALETFGTLPVLLAGAFTAGCIVMRAWDTASLARRRQHRALPK